MFKIKLYKYDSMQEANGYRGVGENDFSRFVAQGMDSVEDITQVMDTSEITLYGLPQKQAFDPETKFIIDIVEYDPETQSESILETLHRVVSRDTPNQPILSDDTYYDHHISFIEPSVIAQKRLVDNIACTYKLQYVSLEEIPAYPPDIASFNLVESVYYDAVFGVYNSGKKTYRVSGKYFQLEGQPKLVNRNGKEFNRNYIDIENFKIADGVYKAKFLLPKLRISYGVQDTHNYDFIGYASIDYVIREYEPNQESPINTWTKTIISNSNLGGSWIPDSTVGAGYINIIDGEWLLESVDKQSGTFLDCNYAYKKYTDTSVPSPTYMTDEFDIVEGNRYEISFSLHQFDDNVPPKNLADGARIKFTGSQPVYYQKYILDLGASADNSVTTTNLYMTSENTSSKTFFATYGVNTKKIVYSSSTPYSALALLQKAIINSGLYEKQNGVYIADINKSDLPFYIDDNIIDGFVDELEATSIIESFYNQKNLWEIMVEVGNYIHAIPELKFGSNDRFMITFNRLGRTDEKQSKSTKLSIFNSRSVEDYISATSSYVTNMVQLGGYIEEWVAPKTTSETLLVSNDTAAIVVSKPIIELMELKVRRNSDGAIKDMTNYIYEENVYKTLSIDFDVVPNRGIALYYQLGTNVITGGNYQLPQQLNNAYTDYAIKKVISCAFNGYPVTPGLSTAAWTNLKVNDYSFFVRYRTKDSVRQSHIRPDLRKYLLNTKWDKYPEHNQFNNQTDVVVDSLKFGSNMFGKLIRTGNNAYDIYEWNDRWENVKHKGELYRINGELYYVAKTQHTIYNSHIISKVSYSKDYNELSNVIGIPSEPRFYEISEQSLIRRDFEINDILLLTDDDSQLAYGSNYLFNLEHLSNLILSEGTGFAKYAVTIFKGDNDADKYDQTVGEKDLYINILTPINAYSSDNTLTYEWDMLDNYSAGDKVIATEQFDAAGNKPNKGSYNSLWAVKYTDIYGKAALLDFYILGNIGTPTPAQTMALPECFIDTRDKNAENFIRKYNVLATNVQFFNTNFNGRGIGLLKDCREAMSINYNLQMATSSDRFVISPYVYLPNKSNVKVVLLVDEVNKLSGGYIDIAQIIAPLNKQGQQMGKYFDMTYINGLEEAYWGMFDSDYVTSKFGVNLSATFNNVADGHFTGAEGYQRVKSIAIICDVNPNTDPNGENISFPYKTKFIVARNVSDLNREDALKAWYWGVPNKDKVFKNKQ